MSRFTGLQFTGLPCLPVFFFVPPRHPGLPVVCRYTEVVHFFMLAEPLLLLHTPAHTLLHTTQHNTLGVAGSSQHLPTHHAMCGRRIIVCPIEWLVLSCNGSAVVTELLPSMYSSIAHSCTNNTVVAGYHDSRRNTDTPYRSLWRYICSSCARAGVFPGIRVCPVYRFFLVLPLQAGKSGHRL